MVVVPNTDPACGSVGGGVGTATIGVGVTPPGQRQFGSLVQDTLRHNAAEQTIPDAQSLFVTQLLLHPCGGVGEGTGQLQSDDPVHSGFRHDPDEHTSPEGQDAFVVQLLLHAGTGDGDGDGETDGDGLGETEGEGEAAKANWSEHVPACAARGRDLGAVGAVGWDPRFSKKREMDTTATAKTTVRMVPTITHILCRRRFSTWFILINSPSLYSHLCYTDDIERCTRQTN